MASDMAVVPERLAAALADRYRIDGEAGRGGMATVYRAWDLKNRRPVALKVLHPELSSALGVERFLREIETSANLAHPHILPLYDSDGVDGYLFYVMPFIEDGTLRKRLEGSAGLEIDTAVSIACDVADALGYAHSHGIIHRDIKPDNILFWGGRAVVGDFGIARVVSAPGNQHITATGTQIGTPAYMSPEQVASDEQLDGRSDIYSLGCVVYEMLTGSVPFTGLSARAVMVRKSRDPVPPIRSVRPEVPDALERAVLKALAKVPADRFATAAEFAASLQSRAAHDDDDVPAESVAVLPFTNLNPDPDTEYFSDGISEEILNALAKIPGLHVAARTSSFAFRAKAVNLAEIGAALKVATVLEGSVSKSGDRLRVNVRLVKVANGFQVWSESYHQHLTDVFEIQEKIAHAVALRLQISIGGAASLVLKRPTENLDAYHLYLKGRYFWEQRGLGLKTALECFGKALGLDPNYAQAHAGLADACILLAEYAMAAPKEILPKARAAVERALHLAPDLAEAHSAAGELKLILDWDRAGAALELQRAISLNPRDVVARYRLTLFCSLVEGRFDEALVHARRAVELDPVAPLPLAQLGMALMLAGRDDEAVAVLRQAVDLAPNMFLPNFHLGVLYHRMGRTEEGITLVERAADVSGRHPTALTALANCCHTMGDTNGALVIFDELSARARRAYVPKSDLAGVAAAAGRVDEAFQLLEQACDDRDYQLIYAKRHPGFSLLQSDPRIEVIYRRIGLS
jgi:eukaryotic-like serine/threonine-protein kinase